jgi:hypothetical protein
MQWIAVGTDVGWVRGMDVGDGGCQRWMHGMGAWDECVG